MPLAPVQRLLDEVHRRSMWQVVGLYLGGSWATLEVVDQFVDRLILPDAVYRTTLLLLAVGLPIMALTAYFEGGRTGAGAEGAAGSGGASASGGASRSEGAAGSDGAASPAGEPGRRRGLHGLFTWKRVLLGGVGAFALLGMGSTTFYASRAMGVGFAAPLIARGVLAEEEPILLAQFANRTPDSLLARAVTEALRVDLSQSGAVRLVDPATVRQALTLMQRDPDLALTEELAGEVAAREGIKAYLAGAVDRIGGAYAVTGRLVSAADGRDLLALRETAGSADEVIHAVDALSRELRTRIGESLGSVNGSAPLPEVTTASLPALEAYATGVAASHRGDRETAIHWMEEAARLDTTFASAYRGLAIQHSNMGNTAAFDRYSALAWRHLDRLPQRERLLTAAAYHQAHERRDSAAHYYRLLLDADPDDVTAMNNLGDQLESMGRYDEALVLYRRAAATEGAPVVTRINIASAARSLGKTALADSAVAAMIAAGDEPEAYLPQMGANAIFAQRDAILDSLQRAAPRDAGPVTRVVIPSWRAAVAIRAGRTEAALDELGAAARLATDLGSAGLEAMVLEALGSAAVAAGDAARALPYLDGWEASALAGPASFAGEVLGSLAAIQLRAGRRAAAEGTLQRADSVAAAAGLAAAPLVLHARALLALEEGDATAALRLVDEAQAAGYGLVRYDYRLTRAQAFEALGRHGEAAGAYASLTSSVGLYWFDLVQFPALVPLAHERAGYAYLAAGDTTSALRHLGAFLELWENGDAHVQPRVRAARERLEAVLRVRG